MGVDNLIVLFLILTAAVAVGVLLFILISGAKSKADHRRLMESIKREKTAAPTPTPAPGPKPTPIPGPNPKPIPTAVQKQCIYEYRPLEKRCICPACDGENPLEAARCCICGQALR